MTQTTEEIHVPSSVPAAEPARAAHAVPSSDHPANQPIALWPEGVLLVAAGATLLLIGLRHRYYLQRKFDELRRAADEFQRQGGFDDLQQVARQASELLKGGG
jgi:hypothetical protein